MDNLDDGDRDLDAVHLVEVELAVLDAEKLCLDAKRLWSSVCPVPYLGRIRFSVRG